MSTERLLEFLENRRAMLKGNIAEDMARYTDPFLSQFMRGRVAVEEHWLKETEELIAELEKRKA